MGPLDLNSELILQGVGLILAGLIKGVSGFALGLVAVGIMVAFHAPQVVVPALLLLYFFTNGVLVLEHRGAVTRSLFRTDPLLSPVSLAAGLCGLPIGGFVLGQASPTLVTVVIGAMISLLAAHYLFLEIRSTRGQADAGISSRGERPWAYGVSFLSGVMEGFLGLGGPPFVLFMLARRYDTAAFVLSFNLFFFIMNPFRLALYLGMGLVNMETLKLAAFAFVFTFAGIGVGMLMRRRYLSENAFRKMVIVLLLLIGLNLLRKGL
jgi:hypothetical protein